MLATPQITDEQRSLDSRTIQLGIFLQAYIVVRRDLLSDQAIKCINSCKLFTTTYQATSDKDENETTAYDKIFNNAVYLIDHSDNIHEALKEYSRALMSGFSKEERQKKGKVYTGDKTIVKWIHDKLEQYSPISLRKTYWEPACGTGTFVLDWYNRLMAHWNNNRELYPEIVDEHEAHKWIIEKCLYYSDIDVFAIRLCSLALFLKDPTVRGLKWNSYCGDSLLDDPFKQIEKFDYVAGNPPYISLNPNHKTNQLNELTKDKLKRTYDIVYNKHGDLFYFFIYKAIRKGALVGFVTKKDWLDSTKQASSKLLQEIFEQHSFVAINDHGEELMFEGATIHSCSFIINIGIVSSYDLFKDGTSIQKSRADVSLYDRQPHAWLPTAAHQLGDLVDKPSAFEYAKFKKPISDYKVGYRKYIASYSTIETYNMGAIEWCIDPAEVPTTSKHERWDNAGIGVKFLIDNSHDSKWGFSLLDENTWGEHSHVFKLIPKDLKHTKFILGIVNSSLIRYYLTNPINLSRGTRHWFKIKASTWEALPIPIPNHCLDALVDKMLIDPQDQVTKIDIDKIVYALYCLTNAEIRTVETFVISNSL